MDGWIDGSMDVFLDEYWIAVVKEVMIDMMDEWQSRDG